MVESPLNTRNDRTDGVADLESIEPGEPARADSPKTNGVANHDADASDASSDDHHKKSNLHRSSDSHATPNRSSRSDQDQDAQAMVISSLRSQIQDLISQVTQLNTKLVQSYDRVSDLEDTLHVSTTSLHTTRQKITQLEHERTQHLSALNTGLLVEKAHVTAELTRLMERATEEAKEREGEESKRKDIERELEELSAELFGRANGMVAEERLKRHESEVKVKEAEEALRGAEEAVRGMQKQMQVLKIEKETAEKRSREGLVGGRVWDEGTAVTTRVRLLSSHTPYQEFLLFVAHLRSIHPASPHSPPAMTTLLPLPFLSRLLNEDSEPTVRLDLAPSLNWLSRRSVLAAIHNGQLIIEPISSGVFLENNSSNNPIHSNVNCALCGSAVFPNNSNDSSTSTSTPTGTTATSAVSSWSASLFKKPPHSHSINHSISSRSSMGSSQPSTPTRPSAAGSWSLTQSQQVYIFRLAPQSSSGGGPSGSGIPNPMSRSVSSSGEGGRAPNAPPSHPLSHSSSAMTTTTTSSSSSGSSTIYPLCSTNWCLSRLRTTCTLWAFVRTGIVDKVWEEEVPNVVLVKAPTTTTTTGSPSLGSGSAAGAGGEKSTPPPPIPPRRRGLWGMATSLGGRAVSWGSGSSEKTSTPPPVHPSVSEQQNKSAEPRRLPPPLPPTSQAGAGKPAAASVPPPLPKRSQVRGNHSPTKEKTSEVGPASNGTTAPSTTSESPPPPQSQIHPSPLPPHRPPRRPMTPASVPLPESRPHTPQLQSVANPALATVTTAVPAGSNPGTDNTTTTSASGATPNASPIPPPLPRRAAARVARPPLVDGSSGGTPRPSRPSTPVTGGATDKTAPVSDEARGDGDVGKEGGESTPAASEQPDAHVADTKVEDQGKKDASDNAESLPEKVSQEGEQKTNTKTDDSEEREQKAEHAYEVNAGEGDQPTVPSEPIVEGARDSDPSSDGVTVEGEEATKSTEKEREKETEKESREPAVGDDEDGDETFVDAEAEVSPVVAVASGGDEQATKQDPKDQATTATMAENSDDSPASTPAPASAEENPTSTSAQEVKGEEQKKPSAVEVSEADALTSEVEAVVQKETASVVSETSEKDTVQVAASAQEDEALGAVDGASATGDGVLSLAARTEAVAGKQKSAIAEGSETNNVSASTDDDGSKEKSLEDKSNGNNGAYIGDATWEERTWKELARLKEEMFWARIGGVRQ